MLLHTRASKFDISNESENSPIYFEDDKLQEKMKDFQYVCCNIPGPGTDTIHFEEALEGCTCSREPCDLSPGTKCACMKYGPAYTPEGKLNLTSSQMETRVLNECNSNCGCPQSCGNRVVQCGITTHLEVFWCEEKGLCLRTLEPIKCGKFVCEYAGEVLTRDEARKRAELQTENDMNYIFVLNEYVSSGVLTTYIDPCRIGNVGRFISHSCEPNLAVYPVRVHNLVPKVCMFSARDIRANEELTYDYGQGVNQEQTNQVQHRKVCKCKTRHCRSYLPFDSSVLTMNTIHRETLRLNWVFLSENLVTDELMDHLLGEFVLTQDMYEEIKVNRTRQDQITQFLFILQRRGPQAFDKFLAALVATNQTFISDQLSQTCNRLTANNETQQMQV